MIELETLIHVLSEPVPKADLGKLGSAFKRDVAAVAYTSFGDLFFRDEQTGQIALAFLSPFELIPLDAHSVEDLFDLFRENPEAASEALHPERATDLVSRLGELGPEEVFIPQPYPMWGGDGSIESYGKGKLWAHVQLVTG